MHDIVIDAGRIHGNVMEDTELADYVIQTFEAREDLLRLGKYVGRFEVAIRLHPLKHRNGCSSRPIFICVHVASGFVRQVPQHNYLVETGDERYVVPVEDWDHSVWAEIAAMETRGIPSSTISTKNDEEMQITKIDGSEEL